jgi:hypothetical protein
MSDWSWKDADRSANPRLRLRYEPGAWGDVLKGVWAVAVADALGRLRSSQGRGLRIVDPFAGAPGYPRVAAVAERLAGLTSIDDPLVRAFLDRADDRGPAELPPAALLARAAASKAGAQVSLAAFDLDVTRRQAWLDAGVEPIPVTSGFDAVGQPADLVLIDPYDFDWSILGPKLAARMDDALLIFYYFNKAPRDPNLLKEYKALRARMDETLGARALLVGRVPSDALLPRAWHELMLAGPAEVVDPLRPCLQSATLALARHISDAGVFEARDAVR